jgi:UDP-N-acetylmuramoyl-L-alanyl-D-glutamate--2,6-diaminopimelate ligase
MIRPLTQNQRALSLVVSTVGATTNTSAAELEKIGITGISSSSNDLEAGDLFCAFAGANVHGATFAKDAIKSGAVAILTDAEGAKLVKGLPVLVVSNPRKSAAVLSSWFYGEPMRDLFSIGITGTNGKTTVSTLCHQILQSAGQESGLIGTVETRIGNEVLSSIRTTPEAAELVSGCNDARASLSQLSDGSIEPCNCTRTRPGRLFRSCWIHKSFTRSFRFSWKYGRLLCS